MAVEGRTRKLVVLAIAASGGVLLAVGAPPQGITWAIWLGFFPLWWVARELADSSLRRRLWTGLVGGMGVGMLGFPWIASTLIRFADAPAPIAWAGQLLFSIWTAMPMAIWMAMVARHPAPGWRGLVWPAVAYVGLATAWPALFPFTVVIGLAEVPAWIQAAEVFGVAGCELQVVGCGVLLAEAVRAGSRPRQLALALAAVAIPAVSYGLGVVRMAALDAEAALAPSVRFGVVQPNVPLLAHQVREKMIRLWTQSALAQQAGAQIVLWPEAGAFPYPTDRPFREDFVEPFRRVQRLHSIPTVFGAASSDPGDPYEYNTVYAMDGAGKIVGAFDKVILVPFGEYVPIVDPEWAMEQIPSIAHNNAGTEVASFRVTPAPDGEGNAPAPILLGPLVCYEDIFPEFAREVATQPGGIDVFVNLTIDAWFGATAEPWEHMALAQFRTVEHRVPMVRSVSAGPSGVIDLAGRVVANLDVQPVAIGTSIPPELLVVPVAITRNTAADPTLYARVGWLTRWLCMAAVMVWLARALARRWRRR